jgi:DNA polymerase-4
LFHNYWKPGKGIRLLGITLQNLHERANAAMQLDLFDFEKQPKKEQLNQAMDRIRDKYGESALLTAGMISNDPSALIRNHKVRGTSLQMDHLKISNFDEES